MNLLDPFTHEFWTRIGVAVVCGAVIGLERQLRGKPAGIRTSILICLGTMAYVQLAVALGDDRADPTRVIGQVVTGIGFLGAGVMLTREGIVIGVTSAAVIWMLAAIGAMIGTGVLRGAIALALVTVAVLVTVELLEHSARWLRRGVHSK
jgi:putative Mg2+ transporter-C (MgtC) family protein